MEKGKRNADKEWEGKVGVAANERDDHHARKLAEELKVARERSREEGKTEGLKDPEGKILDATSNAKKPEKNGYDNELRVQEE